jgi:hypothetical protein
MINESGFQIDEKRLNRMKLKILGAERENIKTRVESEQDMIEKVKKIIEEEVKKCY